MRDEVKRKRKEKRAARLYRPIGVLCLLFALGLPARAEVFLSAEQALAELFPSLRVEKKTLYLTEEQVSVIEKEAHARLPSRIITRHTAYDGDAVAGYVYFDTHTVRTMPETIAVLLDPTGAVRQVMLLSFFEPMDYLPRNRWLEALQGHRLDKTLRPGRGVPKITGATLTVVAITDSVRRVLAVHEQTRETRP